MRDLERVCVALERQSRKGVVVGNTNRNWWLWRKQSSLMVAASGVNIIPLGSGATSVEKLLGGMEKGKRNGRGTIVCLKCFNSGHQQAECRNPWLCRCCNRLGHHEKVCLNSQIFVPSAPHRGKALDINRLVSKNITYSKVLESGVVEEKVHQVHERMDDMPIVNVEFSDCIKAMEHEQELVVMVEWHEESGWNIIK